MPRSRHFRNEVLVGISYRYYKLCNCIKLKIELLTSNSLAYHTLCGVRGTPRCTRHTSPRPPPAPCPILYHHECAPSGRGQSASTYQLITTTTTTKAPNTFTEYNLNLNHLLRSTKQANVTGTANLTKLTTVFTVPSGREGSYKYCPVLPRVCFHRPVPS